MSVSSASAQPHGAHDRGYHRLTVRAVTVETGEAKSFAFDISPELAASYAYKAGQFITFRIEIDGSTIYRSYSMSTTPGVDSSFAVTVKRVPGGAVSNWMIDALEPGATIDASVPTGVFCLGETERDLLTFAAGSGITPIYSLIKAALADPSRSAELFYANRDRAATIFAAELDELMSANPERLIVAHHHDADSGFIDATTIEPYVERARNADCYVCGPAPFMDVVEAALLAGGVPAEQIHIERFAVAEPADAGAADASPAGVPSSDDIEVTIELNGATKSTQHHPGTTVLQVARQLGMSPPFSCEAGNCATCMAKLIDGEVKMFNNTALFDDEVADGWILTCQSVPTTPTIHVVYGYEGT
jgi:ferredoxin-NADP reductase